MREFATYKKKGEGKTEEHVKEIDRIVLLFARGYITVYESMKLINDI